MTRVIRLLLRARAEARWISQPSRDETTRFSSGRITKKLRIRATQPGTSTLPGQYRIAGITTGSASTSASTSSRKRRLSRIWMGLMGMLSSRSLSLAS